MQSTAVISEDRLGALLTQDLLDELDKAWPNLCPDPKDPDLVIKCAERKVINVLHQRFKSAAAGNPHVKVL